MKLLLTVILMLVASVGYSQSFYAKKMKKVKYSEIRNCAAMKPDKTFSHRRSQAVLYRKKRVSSSRKG